jgi:signal transduction histidine kinase/integral membrane sensor domain MASE1
MPLRTSIALGKSLILIGVVTVAYFLLGLLGLLFRIPSDPVSIFMPSVGLALAVALVYGIRALPAIVIGNISVNAWLFDFNQGYLYFYAASAIGAAFSAYMGVFLIRRTIGFPNPLVDGRKILLFMCLGGPVSCLISAVISITVMYWQGIIGLKEIPLAGLSWWMADILGVLIFTPITLILLAEPYHIWFRRRATVGLPILLTFTLVVALFFYLNSVAREQYTEQLKEKTITLSQALKGRVQLDLAALDAIKNFLLGSQSIEPKVLSNITKQTLSSAKEIQSINWVKISDAKGEGSQVISTLKDAAHNKADVLETMPPNLKKKLQGSSPILFSKNLTPDQDNFKLLIPVVDKVNKTKNMLGVIVATVSMKALVQQALESLNTTHCAMTISTSQDALADAKVIYSNIGSAAYAPYQTIPIQAIDQTWIISFYHDWTRDEFDTDWPIGSIILSGLWFTGILGIVLLHLTGRYFRTETIIDERTKILTETKIAAEQANQAKNQFLAKISHELRTPLNGISGFTQLLEKKPNLNAEDKKQVAIIKQCSDDLLRLINDILDISAIETQQMKLEIGDFNFALLLTDSIRICKFRADEKGLTLYTKNNCLPRKFQGDEKRIRQILVNLIDNAVKYTSQGSVTVTASYQDGIMKISVVDTGSGIAQKHLERIFSPFVQINTDNFTREGIGLGLSITKELVNLMAGEMTVISQPGIGSTFTVTLPLPVSEKNQAKVITHIPTRVGNSGNDAYVLVVDDSEINLIFLVTMLEQLGCKVDSAVDGREALGLIEQNSYDFALIDINMPVMNGLELAIWLRSRHFKLKLIAVSAYADEGKINEALIAGFDAYITKPIEEHQLVTLIQASY